jgi:hypothetical protein
MVDSPAKRDQLSTINHQQFAMRLKSRVMQIPNGFRWVQSEVNWNSVQAVGKFPSWETLIRAVIAMRLANQHQMVKHGWSVDVETVAAEVDAYNAKVCMEHGWNKYITGGSGGSLRRPPLVPVTEERAKQLGVVAGKARKIWAGVRTLNGWLDSGEGAVLEEVSLARAKVCLACPMNGRGDFTKWFTVPAADAIKRQMERLGERKLTSPAGLGVCEACLCPLAIKVWTPMKFIRPYLSDEVVDALRKGKDCWVLKEMMVEG